MLQYGKDSGLPETYRITLAVSVAFLVHTLLMAGFSFELPDHNHNPVTVSVQLMPQGSTPSSESEPSPTHSSVRATPFSIKETPEPTPSVQTTTSAQPRKVPEPEPEAAAETSPKPDNRPAPQPEQQNASSSSAPASAPSAAGEQSAEQQDAKRRLALRSEAPSEESSYISLLAQTIGEKAKIRKLEDMEKAQVLSVELELNLMSNGALVGAKITEPSGNDGLDQQVYRAALSASPYPEPPSSTTRQQRFRVEVRYTF